MQIQRGWSAVGIALAVLVSPRAQAKDLGDVLLEKGVITKEELRQAREEEKQKSAAEESRRDAITAKLPKWLEMVTLFGDLRSRYEGFYESDLIARNRFRIRARIGATVRPSDEIAGTIRLTSGNPNDPISTNQDFTSTFTRKSISLDQAYLNFRPGKTFHLEPGLISVFAGKMPVTAYRVSELVWDDDLSPEGASETVTFADHREGFLRSLRLNAFQWEVDEISNAEDPWMIGGQVVAEMAFGNTASWTLAGADYHYENLDSVARKYLEKSSSSFNSSLANSNRVDKDATGKILGYTSGFNILNASTELNFSDPVGLNVPGGIYGDLAYNTQADGRNLGTYVGIGLGNVGRDYYHNSLKNPGEWAVSYTYVWVEQDALLSLFSYSDFDYVQASAAQKGSTNSTGHILRLDYVILPNVQLTAKSHFINALHTHDSNAALNGNPTLTRLQLDAVLKF